MLFSRKINPIVIGPQPDRVIVVRPSNPIVVGPARQADVVIRPERRGVWEEKGWRQVRHGSQDIYDGYYLVMDRRTRCPLRFSGRIIAERGEFLTYIADPPKNIKNHPKGPCFSAETPPWFHLHWHHAPENVDEAILYMEKILAEVLNINSGQGKW